MTGAEVPIVISLVGTLRGIFTRPLDTVHLRIETICGATDITGMTRGFIIGGIIIQGAFTDTIAITGDIRCMTITISVLWCAKFSVWK